MCEGVLVILVSHLLSRSDGDPPDAVSVRRVAVWESGRGEVSSAVLQVFPTLFNKPQHTQSGNRVTLYLQLVRL